MDDLLAVLAAYGTVDASADLTGNPADGTPRAALPARRPFPGASPAQPDLRLQLLSSDHSTRLTSVCAAA